MTYAACGTAEQMEGDVTASTAKDTGEDIQAALSALTNVTVLASHDDSTPAFIQGRFGQASRSLSGLRSQDAHESVLEVLRNVAPVFRLSPEELYLKRVSTDDRGHQFLRYGQTLNGREVLGAELILFLDRDGSAYAVNSSARGGQRTLLATQPGIAPEAAAVSAAAATDALRKEARSTGRTVYVRGEDGNLVLAHEIQVTGVRADGLPVDDRLYVNAQNRQIALRDSRIHTALNRAVYSANNGSSLPGTLKRQEGGAATNDAHVDLNYEQLGKTYDCYKTNFNRDSYNGAGAQLKSTVHYSSGYVNAYWDGTQMVYGDGDGTTSIELGKDLDVTVHELTHAVTENESDLVYSNESGALNEGMSDIFAAYCESWTTNWATGTDVWLIGEDIWTPGTANDALRYMNNPTKDGSSRDYYPERYTGSSDNGGVHWNSGIANLAFYLLSVGGNHPRAKTTVTVTGIGVQKAGKIFYEANANCMTSSSNFAAAKTCTEQKADAFYPADKASVTAAWTAVGVGVTVAPGTLTNGTPVTGLSDATNGVKTYKLTVPAGQTSLKFVTTGGSGDLDLYVKLGSAGDASSNNCKSEGTSSAETCTITNPAAGDWYVTLLAYASYSGVTLTGTYSGSTGGGNVLTNGAASTAFSGAKSSWTCWTLAVPSGKTTVTFNQAGGTGDADLFVQVGAQPTSSSYKCKSAATNNTETCSVTNPAAGTYYVCSYGYAAYTNTTLKGTY
ncbi:M4 family metallopeptidase [Stigmatella sp. ncwal1]|uniref:M4 family metallopeptidase n=1 Tax=Stigmatella ashevillensis TaxID=2995309 RepID=A0ABT5D3I3_9BACT|nr:M4 family metallopeptidase [Stigmatella ashevillena]MDC0708233.1 M4 family metallopeptidase [Stigmatella ashevillena]